MVVQSQSEKIPQIIKQSQKSKPPKMVAIIQRMIASVRVTTAQYATKITQEPAACEVVDFLRGLDECSVLVFPIS